MFLFRIVFWLGLLVLLLPTDEHQQAKLYETAAASVERLTTFCERNPKACAAAAECWSQFVKKAEFGGRVVVDLLTSRGQRAEAGVAASNPRATGTTAPEPKGAPTPRNTLTREDPGAGWRGQAQRTGA
jgi:uncharacterized protein DUF5330